MPNPTRFPFGIALGFYNQFNNYGKGGANTPNPLTTQYENTTAGLLAQANTAPDVSMGTLFFTNNTGNTTITNFIHRQMGRAGALLASGQIDTTSPPPEGKWIRVIFLDNSTQVANNSNILLTSSDNGIGSQSILDFMASNGVWNQIGPVSRPNSNGGIATFTGAGTTSFSASGISVEIFQGTGATTLQSISGGQIGQSFTILQNTAGVALTINTAGNILIAGTNSIVLSSAGANYTLTRFGTSWFLDRGAV